MMLIADRAPSAIANIDDRLRSRFEGGLVLEVKAGRISEPTLVEQTTKQAEDRIFVPDLEAKGGRAEKRVREPGPVITEPPVKGGAWFPSPENVVIHWPRIDELLIEELD
jgi:hypothetical protein